jgi:hypothetical protein
MAIDLAQPFRVGLDRRLAPVFVVAVAGDVAQLLGDHRMQQDGMSGDTPYVSAVAGSP